MIRLIKEISPKQREWRNDSRIMAWTRGSELLSDDDQRRWLEKIVQDRTIQMFGIETKEKENVGTCGLTSITLIHRTAEFSLFVAPEFQKKGYGKQALIALCNYGFNNLGLRLIWGEVFDGNPAMKMFEKVGFKKEAKLRHRYFKFGDILDTEVISMTDMEFYAKYAE